MKVRPILYAAVLALAGIARCQAQDELDKLSTSLSTPAPAPRAATTPAPRPAPSAAAETPATASRPTASQPPPRATPRPTAQAAPRAEAKPDLAHARFVQEGDLAGLAGKKLTNTYLTGTFKANGQKEAGRRVFTTRSVLPILGVIRGGTRILVKYMKPVDPRTVAEGNSCMWVKDSPLRVERVENGSEGVTVYATDLP